MVADFALSMRLYNNQIRSRRNKMKITQGQLAGFADVSIGTVNGYESLRESPVTPDGQWREPAKKLADFFEVEPAVLWPEAVLAVKKRHAEFEITGEQAQALAGRSFTALPATIDSPEALLSERQGQESIDRALSKLPKMERDVIERVIGWKREEETLEQIGESYGRSREAMRQHYVKGIKKLGRNGAFLRRLGVKEPPQLVLKSPEAVAQRCVAELRGRPETQYEVSPPLWFQWASRFGFDNGDDRDAKSFYAELSRIGAGLFGPTASDKIEVAARHGRW